VPVNMPLWYQMKEKRIWVTNLKNNSFKYYTSFQSICGIMEPMQWRGKSMQIGINPKPCTGRSKFCKVWTNIFIASFQGASSLKIMLSCGFLISAALKSILSFQFCHTWL
jgi:hypothetical protein